MFNLAVGLAVVTMWLIAVVGPSMWFAEIFGVPSVYLAIFGFALFIWSTVYVLFWRKKITLPRGRTYWVLLFSNVLAVSTLIFHAYNSTFIVNPTTVDEIMNPRLSEKIEFYLRVVYPFARILIIACVIIHIVFLVRTARSRLRQKASVAS